MICCHCGKYALDCIIATAALIIFAPVYAALALVIVLTIGTPVLFRQKRIRWHGKLFTLLKFRAMVDTQDALGNFLSDAQRMTRIGSFLRRTSVDELPELLNVLAGQMSLVGLRPCSCTTATVIRRSSCAATTSALASRNRRRCMGVNPKGEVRE